MAEGEVRRLFALVGGPGDGTAVYGTLLDVDPPPVLPITYPDGRYVLARRAVDVYVWEELPST